MEYSSNVIAVISLLSISLIASSFLDKQSNNKYTSQIVPIRIVDTLVKPILP